MAIILDNKQFTRRGAEIRRLLNPLSKDNNSVSVRVARPQHRGTITLGAFGGQYVNGTDYKDWSFKTKSTAFNASYFEVWSSVENKFSLEKAYFKLMSYEERSNQEVLSLHIDPTESDLKYKTGPHVHVKRTTIRQLEKAHISLNLSDLKEVVNSYEKFNQAYRNALTMINDEIIMQQ